MLLPAITGAWKHKESGCFVGSIEEMWNVDLQKLQRPDFLDGKAPRSVNMVQIGNALNDKKLSPLLSIYLFGILMLLTAHQIAAMCEKAFKEKIYLQ